MAKPTRWTVITACMMIVSLFILCSVMNYREVSKLHEVRNLHEKDFNYMREEVIALGKLRNIPSLHYPKSQPKARNPRRVYFDSVPYKGHTTRVFCWLGVPETKSAKVPAMVLVHGGGGNAFEHWVKRWNDIGYAAISIAVEGQIKNEEGNNEQFAGPARSGIYDDWRENLEDQWMYHAVAATVLANNVLKSLPEIDDDHIGLMGISWGGVIALNVGGIDPRFSFIISVYGTGSLTKAGNEYEDKTKNNDMYKKVWDPDLYISNSHMPIYWLTWPTDIHFPLTCLAASYHAAATSRDVGMQMLSIIPGLQHGHAAAWDPYHSYAFAQHMYTHKTPWLRQQGNLIVDNDKCIAKFSSDRNLDRAELISTSDQGFVSSREWIQTMAVMIYSEEERLYKVFASIPSNTTGFFINIYSLDLVGSSLYIQIN